jgi:P-type conjugative transfer protein TrbJ
VWPNFRHFYIAVLAVVVATAPIGARAQLATFDAANFVKNSLNELNTYQIRIQQAEQLAAQLQQLQQELRSGAEPSVNVWRNAQAQLAQLTQQLNQFQSLSVGASNLNSQFATYYPGCGSCNNLYSYNTQIQTATTNSVENALKAAAAGNQDFANENLSLDTLKNANTNGSQYAAIVTGNQIAAMMVEQMQKERLNQSLLMQAEVK